MKRPYLPTWIILAVAAVALPGITHARDRDRFQLVEATIADIHDAFRSGILAPEELVRMYLARVAAYDQAGPQLNSFMHVNEHALSAGMPTGYSSQLRLQLFQRGGDLTRAGYGFDPFDPRTDPRQAFNDGRPALATGGSSSGPGIAVSANLATVGVGTETSGSILSPATQNLLVGIKPTVGLVSRTGIVPITADQDTAGPMARTVTDAAKLLGVLAGFDPQDPATAACLTPGNCFSDYTL